MSTECRYQVREFVAREPRSEVDCEPHPLIRGLRTLSAAVVRGWLHLYHRLTVIGLEHLPVNRSFVMIANHASHLDTLCLLSVLPLGRLHQVYPLAARDYWDNLPRSLLTGMIVNALPFERRICPWQHLDRYGSLLDNPGTVLILFPEGTRTSRKLPADFKPGIAMLAAGRDIPVLPCHLKGTGKALPKGSWFPKPRRLRLTIGAPRLYSHLPANRETAHYICRDLRDEVVRLGQQPRSERRKI